MADNISWGTFGLGKVKEEKEKYIIPRGEFIEYKETLLENCNQMICSAEELYSKASSKELYDTIVNLNSLKKSLQAIYIKELIND